MLVEFVELPLAGFAVKRCFVDESVFGPFLAPAQFFNVVKRLTFFANQRTKVK
ncbi:MAG: hypothetical protein ACLP7I_03865 [Limisphaerales bacterium]